jgi:hypothetical protein
MRVVVGKNNGFNFNQSVIRNDFYGTKVQSGGSF